MKGSLQSLPLVPVPIFSFATPRLLALCICVLFYAFCPALCGASGAPPAKNLTPVLPVNPSCPRFIAGTAINEPPALYRGTDGYLRVFFSYQTIRDPQGRQLFCFMTPDGMENPTLHVHPGDHLDIIVTNNTPAGTDPPMPLDPINCGDVNMTNEAVNIHFHGTNTSPNCGQDDVVKTIINPGQTFEYNVFFPTNEPPGLYWYHPHVHGVAEAAGLGGGTGALIVDGIESIQPAVTGLLNRTLVIRDQHHKDPQEAPGTCVNPQIQSIPFQDITVNNVPVDSTLGLPATYTPAILATPLSSAEFWRVANASADTILDLAVVYDGVPQTMALVGIDGVPVNSQDGTVGQGPNVIEATHFRLPPASRVEFVVTTPSSSVVLAQLITNAINTGPDGDCDPVRPVFTIVAGVPNKTEKLALAPTVKVSGRRFAGLAKTVPAQTRLLHFSEYQPPTVPGQPQPPEQFYMTVDGQPDKIFQPNEAPGIIATTGSVETWTVQNLSHESHEFHIHQIHFLVMSQNNFAVNGQPDAPYILNQYLDMIEIPAWDPVKSPNAPPSVTLKMDFREVDPGFFVFHCHILGHEDLGMMNIMEIQGLPARKRKHAPSRPAKAALSMPDMH